MFSSALPLLLFTLGGAGDLEIVAPRATFGLLGPTRPKGGVLPGERLFFAFGIKNLAVDAQGKSQYSVAVEIRDSQGKLFYEQKPYLRVAQNLFGGKVVPCSSYLDIPITSAEGDLHWKVTIEDTLAKKSKSIDGKGKILPKSFGIVRVNLSADPNGLAPTPAVNVVGGHVFLNFSVVGFDRNKDKQPDVEVSLRILNTSGQPISTLKGRIDDVGENVRIVPGHFPMIFDSPGNYTLEVSALCQHSKSKALVTLPVQILGVE